MHAPLPCESRACLSFMRLLWPMDWFDPSVHLAAHFLTLCDMEELLGLYSLYLVPSLGWALLRYRFFPFSIQPLPSLWVGWHFCHAAPLLLSCCYLTCAYWTSFGLAIQFPFTQFTLPSTSAGLVLILFWASLAHFIHLGLPRPASFLWASLAYSISTFPWVSTKSFRLPRLNYHTIY